MPKQTKPQITLPYIGPFEVVIHNIPDDCWVSFLGKVYNVTPLVKEFEGQRCIKPILAAAGKDISHWFDKYSGDIQHYTHPVTGVRAPYCPHGPIPHVEPKVPATTWKPVKTPWWQDDAKYFVGPLTKRVRPVKIINALIAKEVTLNVCCEDTINRIMERYSKFNTDGTSYIWRFNNRTLIMDKTLEENYVIDQRDILTNVGIPANIYIPAIFLFYKDDLKWEDVCT